MSDVSERYAKLADAFTAKVAAVPDDAWGNPTPCSDWTARDLVRHVVEAHGMFLGFVGRQLAEGPAVDDDPLGAFESARATVQADLDDPERAGAEFDGLMGRSTFEAAVDRFLCFDLVVHGWDLARATGQDTRMDPDEVPKVRRQAEAFGDALRGPGAFGPEVAAPPGADEQAQLLAFLGRQP